MKCVCIALKILYSDVNVAGDTLRYSFRASTGSASGTLGDYSIEMSSFYQYHALHRVKIPEDLKSKTSNKQQCICWLVLFPLVIGEGGLGRIQ